MKWKLYVTLKLAEVRHSTYCSARRLERSPEKLLQPCTKTHGEGSGYDKKMVKQSRQPHGMEDARYSSGGRFRLLRSYTSLQVLESANPAFFATATLEPIAYNSYGVNIVVMWKNW